MKIKLQYKDDSIRKATAKDSNGLYIMEFYSLKMKRKENISWRKWET